MIKVSRFKHLICFLWVCEIFTSLHSVSIYMLHNLYLLLHSLLPFLLALHNISLKCFSRSALFLCDSGKTHYTQISVNI